MKTKRLLLGLTLALLLILTGCGSTKNNPSTPTQNTEKISNIIIDRIGNELVTHPDRKVISTQELFETVISDLEETANAFRDKEQILSWIKALNDVNIDFEKDNILIYTFRHHSICEYKEDKILKEAKQIDITFTQTNEICMDASIIYYLAYKVSKDIEKIRIKAFEQEYMIIDMR